VFHVGSAAARRRPLLVPAPKDPPAGIGMASRPFRAARNVGADAGFSIAASMDRWYWSTDGVRPTG
jgi:hypothetical protein